MPLKKTVNDSLSRLTGYQVTRAQGTGASLSARQVSSLSASSRDLAATAQDLAATVRDLEAALKQARGDVSKPTAAKPKPKAETFPRDYDEDFCEIIRAVRPYSMTGNDKLHALISATKYVSRYNVPGDIVEFGVWRGGGMKAVALTLEAVDDFSRELYLYDTFEGMTAPTEKDVRFDGAPAAGLLETSGKDTAVWAVASLEDVQQRFAEGRYPQDKIHYIKGPVEETIPAQLPEQISILRLDTDWYESTDHEFKHAYDRLVSGGVLMIDDYGWWQGSRTATDEFLERTGEKLLLLRMASGRVAIKP
ncbi:MAG: O-methyltransferase [Pseudonocardiales bacterium]|nr:O-methyltransferase [Pseudonocardiales bacterium]